MIRIWMIASWIRRIGLRFVEFLRHIADQFTAGFRDGNGGGPFPGTSRVPKRPKPPRRGASAANPLPARESELCDLVGPRN